ncbi:ArsR family transcriptional regulator [Cupriavidus sp. H39]|uniref:ArsR family transcriptional regulator n=1 Tax=Cupriavidus sp. H39 TaxID=3401635 RepID=UPI003D0631A0
METQEGALTLALMTQPARATICRALLEAGEAGLPAADLARLVALSLPRAAHLFQELLQAEVVALSIRERQVCYVLKARRQVREALSYIDSGGLAD